MSKRPSELKTKIFLDGGDPKETKEIIGLLGFLDGQTTNPTLISKNPEVEERLGRGKKFSKDEIYNFYKRVVREIAGLIPEGSISIEVYADFNTVPEDMFNQAKEMYSWISNARVKFPITKAGLTAATMAVEEEIRINMTLCFTQQQAAAVYSATKRAAKGSVYVSPFVGRLDDRGEDGMSLIANIIKMYKKGNGHVEVLTASVRNIDHLLYGIYLGSDIITAPFGVLKEWAEQGMLLPDSNYQYKTNLKEILYKEIDLNKSLHNFDISHELTKAGIERFSNDWNILIE